MLESRAAMPIEPGSDRRPRLVRSLGWIDGVLLTVGAVIGTGIFLTPGDVARAVPHPLGVLLVWLAGGGLVLAGALAYAELGAMMPEAGGLYRFLRRAWGPLWGFLYGWSCLLVIMSGGNAAIAVGFGEYFGVLVPAFASSRELLSIPIPGGRWSASGAQVSAAIAILALTAVNHFGVRTGALVQAVFTVAKLGALGALALAVFLAPSLPASAGASLPLLPALAGFGTAMIAALWTYDGWYALSFTAGEVRDPRRNLPLGLIGGAIVVTLVYVMINGAYLRVLSPAGLAETSRAAEAAAGSLWGASGALLMTAAVAVSAFGCLAATILYASRIYPPMADDGLFFAPVGAIHPRWHTPVVSLWIQGAWSALLALSGSYTQLFTYVTFVAVLFHVAGGLALFRLRAREPQAERPYRAPGYPWIPGVFVAGMVAVTLSTFAAAPRESLAGLGLVLIGAPIYRFWSRRAR